MFLFSRNSPFFHPRNWDCVSHDSLTPKASFLKNRDSLESVRICFAFSSFSIFFCVILRPGTWPKGLTLKKTKNQNRGPSLCSGRQLLKTRFPPRGMIASLGCFANAIGCTLRNDKPKIQSSECKSRFALHLTRKLMNHLALMPTIISLAAKGRSVIPGAKSCGAESQKCRALGHVFQLFPAPFGGCLGDAA